MARWRVTVLEPDTYGKRLLWAICKTRRLARIEAKHARENYYPTRIRKVIPHAPN